MSDRKGGIISKVFSSYDTLESAWEHGVIYGAVSSVFASAPMRKLRISMSRSLEGSLLVRFFSYVCGLLSDVTLRTYGVFIFSSGLYSAVVYAIKYVSSSLTAELDALITGVLLMILSLPLLFSSKTLAHAAADSRIGSFVAFDMLGFWRDGIAERESAHDRGDVAMLLGLLVGLSTFYFDAAVVLLSLLILLLVFVVFSRPEAGVIILFAFFPLMSEAFACSALLMIFASYVFKLARGRRTLKFDIVDAIFLIFSLQLLMGAAVNYGAGTSYTGNYTYAFFTLAYFLIKNLMTDDKWRMRMMRSAVFGGCILAAVALLHKLFDIESLPLDGIGSSVLASRIELFESILSSAEALAPYMTAMMIIMAAYIAQRGGSTAFTALFIAAAAAAAVLMGSRGVWLGILFGVFALFIIAGKRFILAPTIAIAALFAASLIF
ncbi:MAG: hypothetical protein LUH54_05580, partial [Firmicutes bacterium]|nr:hypothetical protein [Bacillota bacterium]